jgi:hypothetical protein
MKKMDTASQPRSSNCRAAGLVEHEQVGEGAADIDADD